MTLKSIAIKNLLRRKGKTGFILAGLVMARLGLGFPDIGVGHDILVYAVALTTTISGVAYLWRMHAVSPTGGEK